MGDIVPPEGVEVPRVAFVPALLNDIIAVADNLRDEDAMEIEALAGSEPREGLLSSVLFSREHGGVALTVLVDGEPEGIMGHHQHPDAPMGVVWLLGTPRLTEDPRLFFRSSRRVWRALEAKYGTIGNTIWAGNTGHIAWLRALGCEMVQHTSNSLLFTSCANP